ncbi:alpha/beta family hydrolase, partial [Streptomyces goshikiensis]
GGGRPRAGAGGAGGPAGGVAGAGGGALASPRPPRGGAYTPGPAELLGTGRPALVLQGGRDPFGRPEEFPPPAADHPYRLVEVPYGDHGFAVPKKAGTTQDEALAVITETAAEWLLELPL